MSGSQRFRVGTAWALLCVSACGSEAGSSEAQRDFYEPPDRSSLETPGTLIRAEEIDSTSEGMRLWRALYVSEAVDGTPVAVSGLVAAPADAPDGERGVVTWAHGTTGVADDCAPSRGYRTDFHDFYDVAPEIVSRGYVAVATDYEGLGTPGVHPYVVGASEGRGVLDIVQAASQIEETGAGNQFVAWGTSQGGHAALFAGEIAPSWSPGLELLGVIAAAPAAELTANIGVAALLPSTRGFIWQIGLGYEAAYEELSADDIFPPDMLTVIRGLLDEGACSDRFSEVGASADVTGVIVNPTTLEPWAVRFDENSPGNVATEAPILLLQGDSDEIVPIVLTNVLAERLCAVGSVSEYRVYQGFGHDDITRQNMETMLDWTDARFAGETAGTTCE